MAADSAFRPYLADCIRSREDAFRQAFPERFLSFMSEHSGTLSLFPKTTANQVEAVADAQSPGLSVCMIVKNESANIADALACFRPFADEIVVVDTGSSDNTKEIAARFTSKIYDFEWVDDFSAARNFAMSKAGKSYQLWVDADDRITPENQGHIESLKSHFDGKKAFYFILENLQADVPPTSCLQLRCTPITADMRFEGRIHEQIFPSAVRAGLELVNTDIVINHLGYMTEETRMAKAKRNLAIMERERAEGRDDGGAAFFPGLDLCATGKERGRHTEHGGRPGAFRERQLQPSPHSGRLPFPGKGQLRDGRIRQVRPLSGHGQKPGGRKPSAQFPYRNHLPENGKAPGGDRSFQRSLRQEICSQSFPHPTAAQSLRVAPSHGLQLLLHERPPKRSQS